MSSDGGRYTRHDEVPVYEQRAGNLDAALYNHVQLALKRLGKNLRLAIPGLKTLDLILQSDGWIVVDRALNDLPVAAWSDFHRADGRALHLPVACRIRLYHAHAGIILQRVLDDMDRWLSEQLSAHIASHTVLDFPRKEEP